VDERFATADSGVFAYVSAAEGGYDMDRFPYIRNWLARVKARPG
jgi:glutathione S-transferase